MSTLPGLFDIRPDERRNTFAAFGTLLAITTGHTLLETARDALFLSKLPAAELPWMYLIIAALALALSQVRRADKKSTILSVLVVAAGMTAGFWALVADAATRRWVLYALYVWSGLFASWVMVQFWTLLGRAHTMTQAKRLYGFIGAGAVLGGVFGAFAARAALAFVTPRTLLVASALLFLLATIPVSALRIEGRTAEPREEPTSSMSTAATLLWKNPYARRVLGIAVVSVVAVTLTDFLFKARIAAAYPDTRVLAAHLSSFYALTNTLALVAQLLIGPWIFRRAGVQRALFIFPTLLFGAASAVLATGGLAAAVLLKGLDGTLRYSLHKTSTELLLVPIPDGTRERIKPIIELVGSRGGQALASIAILGLVAVGASETPTVAAFIVAMAVLWLAIVISIRGHYLAVFRETLRAGGLSGRAELPELDLGALELLFAGLNSSRDVEVLAALELLAEQHRERLIPALILYHPSRDVVLRALEIFTRRGQADFVSIADRLDGHPDREIAAAALRARTAVLPDRKLLEERLVGPCPQVAVTALVALVARGWIDPDEADGRLREVLASPSWETAAELARAIRDTAVGAIDDPTSSVWTRFDEALVQLAREARKFRDGEGDAERAVELTELGYGGMPAHDVLISLEVARAMAARRQREFLPVLVGMLSRHELRATARAAIAGIPGALDFLDEILAEHDFARDVRVHIPRTMVLFDPALAARKLLAHLLTEKDGAVRYKILRALVKLRHAHPGLVLEQDILARAVDRVLEAAEELRRWHRALTANDEPPASGVGLDALRAAHHLLVDLIRDKERHATQRLFMLLDLVYAEDFEDIERGLRSKKPTKRASSLELVENLVRPPLRGRVLALVGDAVEARESALSYEQAIREILSNSGMTLRTLAEYRALELGIDTESVLGRRATGPTMIDSLGKRVVGRARELIAPAPASGLAASGVTRAPA